MPSLLTLTGCTLGAMPCGDKLGLYKMHQTRFFHMCKIWQCSNMHDRASLNTKTHHCPGASGWRNRRQDSRTDRNCRVVMTDANSSAP